MSKSPLLAARWLVLDWRSRRLGVFLFGTAVTGVFSLLAPPEAPVILRDLSADPWQIIWCLPACFLPMCMDPGLDYMEDHLARSPASRRLGILLACCVAVSGSVAMVGTVSDRSLGTAFMSFCFAASVAVMAAVVLGMSSAVSVTFTVVLAVWVFGISETSNQPYAWAVLIRPPTPPLAAAAFSILTAVSSLWVFHGTASKRRSSRT